MKKIFIALLLLAAPSVFAQSVYSKNTQVGARTKTKGVRSTPEFIGIKKDEIILVRPGEIIFSSNYFLEEYDKETLSLTKDSKTKFKYENNSLDVERQLVFGNELLIIASYLNKSTDLKHYFLIKQIQGKKMAKPVLLGSVDWKNVGAFGNKRVASNAFKISISPDGKTMAVLAPKSLNPKKKEAAAWEVSLLDTALRVISKNEFTVSEADLYIHHLSVDNDGTIYCSAIQNISSNKEWFSYAYTNFTIGNYTGDNYFFLKFDLKTKESTSLDLGLKNERVITYSMQLLDGDIYFYGVLGDSLKRDIPRGSFLEKVSLDGQMGFKSTNISDFNLANKATLDVQLFKGGKRQQRQFIIREIVKFDDGSIAFLTEKFDYYVEYSRTHGNDYVTQYIHYIFSDVLVSSYSAEGEFKWMTRVAKNQHSINDNGFYSSYFFHFTNNTIHLLLNDLSRQVAKAPTEDGSPSRPVKWGRVVLATVKVTADGNLEREALHEKKEKKNFFRAAPSSGVLRDGELYMFGVKKRGLSWLYVLDDVVVRMKLK